jgi:hypothetical protein
MRSSARSISLAPCLAIFIILAAANAAGAETDPKLEQAAAKAEANIPFVYQGKTYVKSESGEISPLLDAKSVQTPAASAGVKASTTKSGKAVPAKSKSVAAKAPMALASVGTTAAAWPARFPRTLLTAGDATAAKGNAAARPKSFNLLAWQTPIKNQGSRGTCYAFAFTAGLEAAYRHKYGKIVDGKYQGPQWILSEESLIHVTKSTLLNRPQTYLFENPSSYWDGVLGVVGDPLMTSVLSEQLMNYRIPEAKYSPYLALSNPPPKSPPGLTQLADANACAIVATLAKTWDGAPPKFNPSGQCMSGNCATQQAIDACEYTPEHIPSAAGRNGRFGVSFDYKAPDGTRQPGAKALSAAQTRDTDLMESLLFEGHEIVGEFFINWKRGATINASFQSSPLWEYDATVKGDGHNMLVVGYDRTDPSPSRWYFILKNSWCGDKYFLVDYEFIRKATRGGIVIMDVVDPAMDQAASLVRGGAWLGIWPVHRSPQSDLDGNLVIRRVFDPNVPVQPGPGTKLQLGEFYPADGSSPHLVAGYPSSDSMMVLYVDSKSASASPAQAPGKAAPPKPGSAGAQSYTWTFGQSPQRSAGK